MYFVFKKLIRRGHLRIIDGDGKIRDFGVQGTTPSATVRLHDKYLFYKLPGLISVCYFEAKPMHGNGGIATVEDGTIYDLIEVFAMNYHDLPAAAGMKKFLKPCRR